MHEHGNPNMIDMVVSVDVTKYGRGLMKNSLGSPDHLLLFGARRQLEILSRAGRPEGCPLKVK